MILVTLILLVLLELIPASLAHVSRAFSFHTIGHYRKCFGSSPCTLVTTIVLLLPGLPLQHLLPFKSRPIHAVAYTKHLSLHASAVSCEGGFSWRLVRLEPLAPSFFLHHLRRLAYWCYRRVRHLIIPGDLVFTVQFGPRRPLLLLSHLIS